MIFYFSGTGNTRWVATKIANLLNCDTFDISTIDCESLNNMSFASSLTPNEPIGFAFPIHGWQPPRIMRRFVRSLPHSIFAEKYVFAVCTCGDETGLALDIFRNELKSKGMTLDFCASVQMPNTYVCLPFMDTDSKDLERSKIENANARISFIADCVKYRNKGEDLVKGTTPWLLTYVIGEYFNRNMVNDRKFGVDSDMCIHCGMCAKVCPVDNITDMNKGDDFSPQWKHNDSCTGCLACYHHCPKHAISYGKITRKKGQYYYLIKNLKKY